MLVIFVLSYVIYKNATFKNYIQQLISETYNTNIVCHYYFIY